MEDTRIGVGSKWRRKAPNADVAAPYAGRIVTVLESPPGRVRYVYDHEVGGGSSTDRAVTSFLTLFRREPAGHDTSNPYLAPRDYVTCGLCLRIWPKGHPEPPACPLRADGRPAQEIIDRVQASAMSLRDLDSEEPPERPRFEPGRNGLGAGIIGRWPW